MHTNTHKKILLKTFTSVMCIGILTLHIVKYFPNFVFFLCEKAAFLHVMSTFPFVKLSNLTLIM